MINIPAEKRIQYLLLTASLVMLLIGVYQYNAKNNFLKSCRLIKCKVILIEEIENEASVYTLKDINNNYSPFTYTVKYRDDENTDDYELHKLYDFYYYPKDPLLSEPKDYQLNYKSVIFFFSIGFVLMVNYIIKFISDSIKNKKAGITQNKNI